MNTDLEEYYKEERDKVIKERDEAKAMLCAIDEAIGDRGVPEHDCSLPLSERVSNIISELKEWRHKATTAEVALAASDPGRLLRELREWLAKQKPWGSEMEQQLFRSIIKAVCGGIDSLLDTMEKK